MIYVMLSRAQTIEQIFILDSLRREMKGWRPDPSALEEMESSSTKAINTVQNKNTEVHQFKILCLNVYSLKNHFEDHQFKFFHITILASVAEIKAVAEVALKKAHGLGVIQDVRYC